MNGIREFTNEQITTEQPTGVCIPGRYQWSERRQTWAYLGSLTANKEQPKNDFDSGLGIGGLGRQQAARRVPTASEIERRQQMQESATYCSECGQSDLSGAMFTTLGDVCDDCV
jgi:hypothetical protein